MPQDLLDKVLACDIFWTHHQANQYAKHKMGRVSVPVPLTKTQKGKSSHKIEHEFVQRRTRRPLRWR